MKEPITSKEIGLSALYAILIIAFAFLINLAMEWFSFKVLFKLLDWFNGLTLLWKLLVLFIGGFTVVTFIFILFQSIGALLSALIFGSLPQNLFTLIFCIVIFLASVVMSIIYMWRAFPFWNFWFVMEFIMLCLFVISLNSILLPVSRKKRESGLM